MENGYLCDLVIDSAKLAAQRTGKNSAELTRELARRVAGISWCGRVPTDIEAALLAGDKAGKPPPFSGLDNRLYV